MTDDVKLRAASLPPSPGQIFSFRLVMPFPIGTYFTCTYTYMTLSTTRLREQLAIHTEVPLPPRRRPDDD